MHQVDEAVSADPDAMAGIHIVGDGEVHIGAQGSIEAASGIAILATDPSGEPPALRVNMDLDGRRMSQVIGNNWIINDGGGTTLVLNGVTLHDGTTGVVPGAVAPNGAFNVQFETVGGLQAQAGGSVRIREEGVRVLDRTDPDPANWVISDPEAGVIADRDFSTADFIETQPEPTEPTPPMFMEEYAPRAALYEALPDVLLRLQHRDAVRAPRSRPERSQWIRVTGRTGSQDFKRSTVGGEYDLDYFEIEAGQACSPGQRPRCLGGPALPRRHRGGVLAGEGRRHRRAGAGAVGGGVPRLRGRRLVRLGAARAVPLRH